MKPKHLILCGLLVATACNVDTHPNYTVTYPVSDEKNNTMAYLVDWDSGEKIDSAIVADGQVVFTGVVDKPALGRLMVDGARGPIFVLEKGDIVFNEAGKPSGTELNDKFTSYSVKQNELGKQYEALDPKDSTQVAEAKSLKAEFDNIPAMAVSENSDNPVGLYWFLQEAYEMSLPELDEAISTNPQMGKSSRVQKLRKALLAKAETTEGKQYKDFEITYNGNTQKLSDFIGNGHYTLVDFWASWCGPCIRQTKVIKELYNKYHGKGLEVVGVAVWDEPANTLKAIDSHGLAWPCMLNGQTGPTDLYGISSIPCIILIDPDGIIVSRDKQDQALIDDVDSAMANFSPQEMQVETAKRDSAAVDSKLIF